MAEKQITQKQPKIVLYPEYVERLEQRLFKSINNESRKAFQFKAAMVAEISRNDKEGIQMLKGILRYGLEHSKIQASK